VQKPGIDTKIYCDTTLIIRPYTKTIPPLDFQKPAWSIISWNQTFSWTYCTKQIQKNCQT